MSTESRRPLRKALADLADFMNTLRPDLYCERYEVCGSIRRQKPDIADVDIVVIPKVQTLPNGDMFNTLEACNLLWKRVDDLLSLGAIKKHIKNTAAGPRPKWGEFCRAMEFRGVCYEIQTADADSFGPWCAIRTGPAELSHKFAIEIGKNFRDGFHLYKLGQLVKNATEHDVFKAAGILYLPPEVR